MLDEMNLCVPNRYINILTLGYEYKRYLLFQHGSFIHTNK